MADRPLVTAVIIFLNGEKYLEEAIESVRSQTYDNWELVLVDDGSTDGATAIAKGYAERYPDRIQYVEHENHENRGMSASRNAGVRAGSGEFISFIDADDIWLPERLEHFLEVSRRFPEAGMIYGPTLYWYSWAEARGMEPPVANQPDFAGYLGLPTQTLIEHPMPMRRFLLSDGGCLPCMGSLLVRRDAFDAVGGFEPAFRALYEDQVFLSKMVLNRPIVVIDEVLDYYRQHSESCCHRAVVDGDYHPNEIHPARGIYLEWLKQYCADHGVADPVIDRAIDRQLIYYRWPVLQKLINAWRRLRRIPKKLVRRMPQSVQDRIGAVKRGWYAAKARGSTR